MTTNQDIEGFFNGNAYPINLNVHQLGGRQLQLQPGEYITDSRGHKVNDPLFVSLCRPGGLSVAFTKHGEVVKPVNIAAPVAEPATAKKNNPGFRGVAGKKTEPAPKPIAVSNPSTGVTAFASIAEAIKAGVVPPQRPIPDNGIPETPTGLPPGVASAKPIEVPEEVVNPAPPMIQPAAAKDLTSPPTNLPEPDLGQLTEAQATPATEPEKKWVCPLCESKSYQHRSQLAFHVKAKHPDQAADIMAGLSGK